MTSLADEAAHPVEPLLEEAASGPANIVAVTHVPPFREAAWYQRGTSGEDFLPHFCKQDDADGDAGTPEHETIGSLRHTHGRR